MKKAGRSKNLFLSLDSSQRQLTVTSQSVEQDTPAVQQTATFKSERNALDTIALTTVTSDMHKNLLSETKQHEPEEVTFASGSGAFNVGIK